MEETKKKIYKLAEFGAIGDGNIVCTEAIQNAIDTAAKNGGGIVTFPDGIFLSGAIFAKLVTVTFRII